MERCACEQFRQPRTNERRQMNTELHRRTGASGAQEHRRQKNEMTLFTLRLRARPYACLAIFAG
eukprot:6182690-Pleurochrysis_carterae.AAC.6